MKRALFILIMAFGVWSFAFAQANYSITSSKMTIAGTSNVHSWESSVTQVNATGEIALEGGALKSIKALTVEIPVKGIKSSKGSVMDRRTWSALKSDEAPTITYKLSRVTAIEKSGDSYTLKAAGSLTIAGKTRNIDLEVKGKVLSDGSLQFEGARKLLMTDFGIDPPTALMGTMRTGDEVTISFSVKMAPSAGSAAAGR